MSRMQPWTRSNALKRAPAYNAVAWIILLVLSVRGVFAFMARTNLSSAMAYPAFVQSFHLTDVGRGFLNSVFFWSMAALQIPMGIVVDRYGAKYPYAICLVIWSLACVGCGLSTSVPELTAALFLAGVGEAIVVPANFRWMRESFRENRMGLAVAIYMAGTKVGPAIGVPIAAWFIITYNSWQVLYLLLGLGGLILILPAWLALVKRDVPRPETENGRISAGPIPLITIMANPVVWGTIIVDWAYAYFLYYCMTWMPVYLVEKQHLSLTRMGMVQFASFLGITVVALLAGWAADTLIRRGRDPVSVRKGFVVAGFGLSATEFFGATTTSLHLAIFWAFFSLSGLGLATANYLALCRMTLIPPGAVGLVSGIQNLFASLAGIVGAILTGWLLQTTGAYTAPMALIAVTLLFGIAACTFLLRREWAPKEPEIAA
ncbi:MFS transporter [Sphingomonas oryzagri]